MNKKMLVGVIVTIVILSSVGLSIWHFWLMRPKEVSKTDLGGFWEKSFYQTFKIPTIVFSIEPQGFCGPFDLREYWWSNVMAEIETWKSKVKAEAESRNLNYTYWQLTVRTYISIKLNASKDVPIDIYHRSQHLTTIQGKGEYYTELKVSAGDLVVGNQANTPIEVTFGVLAVERTCWEAIFH